MNGLTITLLVFAVFGTAFAVFMNTKKGKHILGLDGE